ncbi:MAG: R3H domain-containing nucleic acid-binding protein [Thermoanaerobaculia bacterium]
MERNRRYFSGHTLQQALTRAASHYGCEPERLDWKEVEKRHGFLKVRRGVIVEVDPDAPLRAEGEAQRAPEPAAAPERPRVRSVAPPEPEPREDPAPEGPAPEVPETSGEEAREGSDPSDERPWWAMPPAPAGEQAEDREETPSAAPQEREGGRRRRPRGGRSRRRRGSRGDGDRPGQETEGSAITELRDVPTSPGERWQRAEGPRAESARRWTGELIALTGLELEFDLFDAGDELMVELGGRHRELAVADRGRVLFAIQHLLPRLMRADLDETPSVRVDSESFQDIREETLRDLAQRAADRVRENRRPWLLEPMAPDERRIVHLTLADDPAVTTESLGEGYFKRVRVQPERGRGR